MFSNIFSNPVCEDNIEEPPIKDEILQIKENNNSIIIQIDKKYIPNFNSSFDLDINIPPCTKFFFINIVLFFLLGNIVIILAIAGRKII